MKKKFFISLKTHFETLEVKLNQMDSIIGDGDHGTTLLKGLNAILSSDLPPAKAFRIETGGASGSLFSILIGAIDEALDNYSSFGKLLTNAANKISMIGNAKEGDKTMLDAIIPAAKAARESPNNSIKNASLASKKGMNNTLNMPARKGRAKYVENAGVGHIDPGAFSSSEILTFFYNDYRLKNEKTV